MAWEADVPFEVPLVCNGEARAEQLWKKNWSYVPFFFHNLTFVMQVQSVYFFPRLQVLSST